MRGTLLAFDQDGVGYISGDDGERYRFDQNQWKSENIPTAGMAVDFEPRGGEALAIFSKRTDVGHVRQDAAASGKSNIAAGLLALFLGGLGIHKFYLGKAGAGITMLLLSIFGVILLFVPTIIIGIIAFIEAIIYLVMSPQEFEARAERGHRSWF